MKAAIYARVQQQSWQRIEDQVNSCSDYAYKNGYEVDHSNIYSDVASSSKINNRPGLLRLLEDSKTNSFGLVIVDEYYRLTRKFFDYNSIEKQLSDSNITIICVGEDINKKFDIHNYLLQIKDLLKKDYIDGIRNKSQRQLATEKRR